jgi:hypothetical protein
VLPLPGFFYRLSDKAVIWFANGILNLNYILPSYRNGGSGDTLYHYVLLLLILWISLAGCVIWSFIDRSKKQYSTTHYWLTVMIRYYLGLTLVTYGLYKVIKVQFASPDLIRLIEPYGDSSPMGLAWTFLGFSDGYNLFMGVAEILAALLFFRRTVTLGALICVAVSANIMAINFFFDVPVKLLSTMLLLMSIFLLAPNFKRLFKLFFNGEAVKLRVIDRPFTLKKGLNLSMVYLKYSILLAIIGYTGYSIAEQSKSYGDNAPKLPLYGVYKVDNFISERLLPNWDKLIIQRSSYSAVSMQGGNVEYCDMTVDTTKSQLTLAFKSDPKTVHRFNYSNPDLDHIELNGMYFDQKTKVIMTKMHFVLIERPFNWVSEEPYNR